MGGSGRIDLECPHAPLLLIGGEMDEIIPSELNEKNYKAYKDVGSVTDFLAYPGRGHFVCDKPGWEEVAGFVYQWVERNTAGRPAI